MGQLAIINAPSTFTLIWSVIRPWLAQETANKVDILGSNYREKLLELVDEESLPFVVGGKCRCEIEGSDAPRCHLSATGPWLEGRVGWGPRSKSMDKPGRSSGEKDHLSPSQCDDATEHGSDKLAAKAAMVDPNSSEGNDTV